MNTPSSEQQYIIDNIIKGYNICCCAVAGSGKSTTILSLSNQLNDKKILQLTYNSSLRLEVQDKVKELELKNINIHTFHSLAFHYYSKQAHTDTGLRQVLLYNMKPKKNIEKIDILVIDENQDLTELYFQFIIKFLLDMQNKIQVVCLGDPRQCIYEFKGADPRFLTMADKIWSNFMYLKNPEFIHCTLKTSYRITDQMGQFVNKALLGDELMLTCRNGEPVTYMRNNRNNVEKFLIYTIRSLLDSGVKPDDIFILAASVKGINSHVRKLENKLVETDIPCHVPIFETEKLDERVIENKIVFSTFHSVKGRQRPYVFIIGFDNNYFMQYARTLKKNECPNTLYVGCTRAIKQLYLIEYDQYPTDRPLQFMKMGHHDLKKCEFVNFKGTPRSIFYNQLGESEMLKPIIDKRYETPSKIVKFIPDYVLNKISPIIEQIFVQSSQDIFEISIPNIVKTDYGYEDVSDLNGIAIPALYYELKCKKNILRELIQNAILELKENEHYFLRNVIDSIPETCSNINDYLFLSNIYISIQERLYFKLKQININQYNWLNEEDIEDCLMRLENFVNIECENIPEFEKYIIHHSKDDLHVNIDKTLKPFFAENIVFRFSAIVDVFTEKSIWELKCTNTITIEHKIQMICYAWLWEMMEMPKREFKLLNIKTGELFVLNYEIDQLTTIIVLILKGKYEKPVFKTNEVFLEDLIQYMNVNTSYNILKNTEQFLDSDCFNLSLDIHI
jgi:hypothetical protein